MKSLNTYLTEGAWKKPLTKKQFDELSNYVTRNFNDSQYNHEVIVLYMIRQNDGDSRDDWEWAEYVLEKISEWCGKNNVDFVDVMDYYSLDDIFLNYYDA